MSAKIFQYLKTNKTTSIIGPIIILVGLYYFWLFFFSGDFLMPHSKNAPNREAILRIQEKIQIGDSYEKVLQAYWQEDSCKLFLRLHSESPGTWSITMPHEFLEADWGLLIKFQDGKICAFGIRNSDGGHPLDAPEDVGKINE